MNRAEYRRSVRFCLAFGTVCSGAAALMFETLWTRSLSLVLGSTVEAAAVAFAAMLMGLAIGARLGGRVCGPVRRPGLACATLEVAIAASGAVVGLGLHEGATELAVWLAPMVSRHEALPAFAIAFGFLALPAIAMGATFPLLVALARSRGAGRGAVAALYGWNTLGAGLGTLGCGFFAIRLLGIRASLLGAAGLDLIAAAVFWSLSAGEQSAESRVAPGESGDDHAEADRRECPETLLFAVSGLSGFCVLALEMVWLRLGGFFLGNRTYAVSTLLASVLVSIALAAVVAARLRSRASRSPALVFCCLFLTASAAIPVSLAAADAWIRRQDALESLLPGVDAWLLGYRLLETLLLSAPAFIALGAVLPLAMMLARRAGDRPGQAEARCFWVNTSGCVAGSLLFGFGDIVGLGSFACGSLIGLLAALIALACASSEARRARRAAWIAGASLAMALVNTAPRSPLVLLQPGETLLHRTEDAYGVFQVASRSGIVRVSNNKTELVFRLGPILTAYVQQMQAHLGMVYNPRARRVLVIGSGYGITAGAFTLYSRLERIDAVEILPAFVEATGLFREHNFDYRNDGRVSLTVDDGRHFLARSKESYDVISVNVSDPHLPGGAALFHEEFYAIARKRLAPGGVLLQHAFGSDVRAVLATLAAGFADVRLYAGYRQGFVAVASAVPLRFDAVEVRALLAEPRVASALEGIGFLPPLDPARALELAWTRETLPGVFGGPEAIASDDRPIIEFAWSQDARRLLHSNE